jgi:hypothetical protein
MEGRDRPRGREAPSVQRQRQPVATPTLGWLCSALEQPTTASTLTRACRMAEAYFGSDYPQEQSASSTASSDTADKVFRKPATNASR